MDITKTYTFDEKACLEKVLHDINDLCGDTFLNDSIEMYLQNSETVCSDNIGDDFYDEVVEKLGDYCFEKIEEIIEKAIKEYCSY